MSALVSDEPKGTFRECGGRGWDDRKAGRVPDAMCFRAELVGGESIDTRHAGKIRYRMTPGYLEMWDTLGAGLIARIALGKVVMTRCVRDSFTPWFQGPFGFVFEDAELFPSPIPTRGMLGIFEWTPPEGAVLSTAAREPGLFGEVTP